VFIAAISSSIFSMRPFKRRYLPFFLRFFSVRFKMFWVDENALAVIVGYFSRVLFFEIVCFKTLMLFSFSVYFVLFRK
jgi:hypothetical protein